MEKNIVAIANTASILGGCMILSATTTATHAAVVINEIDYDQPGSDIAEFIELFNPGPDQVSLDGYTLELVNGNSGNAYRSLDLAGLTIAANGYMVFCGDTLAVANCNIDIASSGWIQNGGSDGDAVALLSGGTVVDSLVYEETGRYLGSLAEGNSFTIADSNSISMSIARIPNGLDGNDNAGDFDSACLTPGSANTRGSGDCSVSVNPVPVPAAIWLFGSGLIGLFGVSRRNISG